MRNNKLKVALAGIAMASMAAVTVGEAQARIGGSSSSSRSSSSASSSSSRSASPAPAPSRSNSSNASSGRLGGGQSAGMTRSGVMESARSQPKPPVTAPAPAPQRNVAPPVATPAPGFASVPSPRAPASPAPVNRPENSRSWVAPALVGAAAGAAAGYALGHTNSPPAAPAPAPAQVPQYGPAPAPAYGQAPVNGPMTAATQNSATSQAPTYLANDPQPTQKATSEESSGVGLSLLLGLALLLGLGFVLYRQFSSSSVPSGKSGLRMPASTVAGVRPSSETEAESRDLAARARGLYEQLQALNNSGDLIELRRRLTPEMYEVIASDITLRDGPSTTTVVSVSCEVIDCTDEGHRFVASVRYRALLSEDPNAAPNEVDEVFHFVKTKTLSAEWKLAGIEEV